MKRLIVLLLICFLLTGDNKMAGTTQGTYWIGTDGNVWVQGANGTNNAGAWDSNTDSYWTGQGYSAVTNPSVNQFGTNEDPAQQAAYDKISASGGGGQVLGSSKTAGVGTTNTSADEQAYYDQQLADIDRLLGRTNTAEAQGLQSLQDSAAEQKRLIEEQRQRALNTYDNQKLETDQSKERGFGQVNDFANNSYRSLMRLFQGGNAGGGSVAKQLMPSLVSKSAGTRRQGVIDQAGQNYRAIDSARADAESQFGYNSQDIENQRKNQERDFLLGIGNQRNSLDTQKGQLQVQRAQASGQGYAQARSAADASRNSVDARQAQLDALFGTYKPQYTARATNLQTPTLGKYTIDPAQINGNQNLSVDSRYYGTQLQKKKQQEQGL